MPEHVLVELGRQADQEIELDPAPALAEGGIDGAVEVLLGDQLVDHRAHPPGAPLGGEGEPGAAHLLDFGRRPHREGIHPQRREAHRDPAAEVGVVDDVAHGVLDAREVRRGQRGQRHLVVAAPLQAALHHVAHLGGRALAHGPGDHARLAETTARGAARGTPRR